VTADPTRVDVILPVLDEAGALPWVLGRMPRGYSPLVVDNGSSDGSADVARAHGARVITEPVPGFGAACYAGLRAAETDVVAFMDADASFDPCDLPKVVTPVRERRSDLVLGARDPHAPAWPLHARWANKALAWELRRRTGLRLTDLGPMRAGSRLALLELGLLDRRFGWPLEMVLRAQDAEWRINEVQVGYHPRVGTSKVTGTVQGTARAIQDMAGLLR
jgi:glycosyltransferase involved in cell wall biosynthesis